MGTRSLNEEFTRLSRVNHTTGVYQRSDILQAGQRSGRETDVGDQRFESWSLP